MSKLHILGSSSAVPTKLRDCTYLAVDGENESILIDCGGSPVHKLLKHELSPMEIDAVVITHTHPDHIYGLPSLFHYLRLKKRKKPLFFLSHREGIQTSLSLLEAVEITPDSLPFELILIDVPLVHAIESGLPLRCHISFTPVEHRRTCFGLRIDLPDEKSLGYSSDTGYSANLVSLAYQVDLLVHEASFPDEQDDYSLAVGHSTPKLAASIASECKAKRLVLVHLGEKLETIKDPLKDARNNFTGEIILAEDDSIIVI